MDKSRSSAYDRFVSFVDQLRNTECSQKQKITCFQQIAECIMSPSLASHINYPAHCGTATNVLLLFCEDLDSVVRMSAEENLNRIFRALEKTRVSRILMDLYGEIKRNGNQRSLRICLNLFSYYAPQIKEKHIKWYAVRLLQCMSTISQRKETLLQETLCDFVKHFGRYVQQGLSDSESCKLFEIFLDNIGADCAVKRRCSAQNCISLIEYARNRSLMARHGLGKVMELLLTDQQTSSVLGALGLLRLLLPQLIRGYSAASQEDSESLAGQQQQQQPKHQKRQQQQQQTTTSDCRQIIEIYDYCLHLLSTQHTTNHAIINATLEVINGILQALDAPSDGQYQGHSLGQSLRQLLCNQQLQHNEYLRRRKSLKNQIFQLKNYEVATSQQPVQDELADGDEDADGDGATAMQMKKNSNAKLQQPKCQQQRQQQQLEVDSSSLGINAGEDATTEAASSVADEGAKAQRGHIRNAARSISECVASVEERQGDDDDMDDDDDDMELLSAECDDFTTLSQLNEQQRSLSAALQLPATTAATTGDKLIDVDADVGGLPKPQHQSSLQNLLAGSEDKSQHLSDIDNESFNSIDFEAEITIAGSGGSGREQQQQQTEQTHPTADGSGESEPGDATAIGTFFNNLLSHSNAASESVSKLFRQSGGSKSTPSKSAHADKSDAVSTASLTLSLSSLASSNMEPPERQPSIAETPTPVEDSLSATASHTASTALMMDAPAEEAGGKEGLGPGMDYSKPETPQMRSTPNANPFLVENSPLRQTVVGRALISVKIGSIMEQSLVYYTARLVAARFLLSGQAAGLQPDSVCRVSIKSLSLAVIAQCVRLAPRVLQLTVEISDQELQLLEQTSCHTESGDSTQVSSPQSSDNSQVGGEKQRVDSPLMQTEVEDNLLLLDIKDDHFGASTCPAYLQQPAPTLTRSADASVLLLGESSASQPAKNSAKEDKLSKSEIIGSSFRPTVAVEDVPPLSLPPRPPKRTKSTRSRTGINGVMSTAGSSQTPICQALSDVLLYHDHCDPILRGGVQQVVGFFLQSSGAGLYLELQRGLGLQHLLAVLLKAQFLAELLHLLGDDDARVREHAACCLCRFIMQTARQEQLATDWDEDEGCEIEGNGNGNGNVNVETQQTNFNLLWDFFDYRIFGSMSVTLRNLFRASSTIVPPLAELDALPSTASACPEAGITSMMGSSSSCPLGSAAEAAAFAASAYFDGSYGTGIAEGHVFALAGQRQIALEEKVLAKVLYRLTNKLMTLNDKNLQFGIIYALRLLLRHFNFVDYQQAWVEFNFVEICISHAYYNNATAADLSCQNDLIDVMGKLMAGAMLSSGEPRTPHLDFLLRHSLKMLNIYYHLVTNQRPPSGSHSASSKAPKSELFAREQPGAAALQALGYFAGDYVYMKLYNILRGANDSYKITINHEAGSLLICLLKTCLNALSLCLEFLPSASPPELKLIEEILHYLTKLINYAPAECVACLRQLLKYLFAQNYASQVRVQPSATGGHHAAFTRPYFVAKGRGHGAVSTLLPTINSKPEHGAGGGAARQPIDTAPLQALGMLFVRGLQPPTPPAGECARLIKLFEPLVIYCLTLFMKSNALIQAPILRLLSQLLELNVTYSILDSKNVIFEQILNNMELIEGGIDRNAFIIVPPMLRFLVQLTHKSDRQLITIPKIISITNNLLASSSVREVALLALRTLSYELFFMHSQLEEALDTDSGHNSGRTACQSPLSAAPTPETREALLAQRRELDTQREVVLGMLEKFIEARPSQQVLALLLLFERSVEQLEEAPYRSAQDADTVYGILCRGLCSRQWRLHSGGDLRLLESCFRNNGNHVLADSKGFLQLLQLFIEQSVGNFGDLALAMVILANVILKTEEIYLVNHIKLYLKNNPTAERRLQALLPATSATPPSWQDEAPSTSSAAAAARAAAAAASSSTGRAAISEINYFAKVLSEKLLACLDALLGGATSSDSTALDHAYCLLAGRFVDALNNVCCRSRHKDALQSVFRLVLAESEFLCKYYSLLLMSAAGQGGSGSLDALLLACMRLTLAMRLEEPVVLLGQAAQLPLKRNLQRALLREVCGANVGCDWSAQQVRRLFDGRYLNFLIADHLEFLCELCQERPECGSLLQVALLQNAHRLSRQSIRIVLRLLGRLCESAEQNASGDAGGDAGPVLQALQLLSRLHQLHDGQRSLQLPMERMARRLTAQSGPVARNDIYERLVEGDLAGGEDQDALRTLLLKDLECRQDNETATPSRIIDESWLFAELIRFATQHADAPQQQKQLMLLLLEIQSEPKLNRLLRSLGAEQEARLLRHAIAGSLTAMLSDFQQKCIQHAPHINYMQPPPLARVSCSLLLAKVVSITASESRAPPTVVQLDVARAVATLMACIRNVEKKALIYIDARLMEKFVGEHLLRQEHLPPLMAYLGWLAGAAKQILAKPTRQDSEQDALGVLLATVDALLLQPPVWRELNACSDAGLRCELLELLGSVARCILQDTIFYQRHRLDRGGSAFKGPAPQAIFLAKLIETQIDIESLDNCRVLAGGEDARLQFVGQELAQVQVPLSLVASIGTSLLRTHHFYAYAVTPPELIQQQPEEQLQQQKQQADGKLPTIPVDSLSDVDILRQFVKRLSILGFTTRQQFEEYFMTCLLLINQLYDEHMVDQQEQFQIKQVCLQAILELLMTYKTFPIVGQANGQFHHTTRWQRITCDSISLKKLHKVQLLVDACSVFYQPNLERQLAHDNVIGTRTFAANQYDLNFSWAQMEAHAGGGMGTGEEAASDIKQSCDSDVPDMAMRNYRHFTQLSGIDFRSSTQLVFDVLQQMIELNHMLVLPNLVKFCEICESRDHIKWIKERCLKLQEQVAMDDTISHQHIIYLLCRSQALLIPSLGELQALCSLIGNVYLKSTHGFIRIATLQGLLCLLECCSKTNTTMGRMSEELTLLRALIVGYINRHGIIDESPLQFSVEHTKLVWTLNYSLIEWTSKFVPQCHLLSNAVIAASNLLKTTADEELYLCVLHGLERMVVNSRVPSRGAQPTGREAAVAGAGIGVGAAAGAEAGVGVVVTPQMRHKIEKLALELLKMENEKFSIPALKLLLSCMYVGSAAQLENTELSNGIVQDDPEIIAQQNDKVDILLHCIKSSTRDAAWIYGQVLCQIIRDLVPPNEILTKVIKEFLAINQPHGDVIAMIVYQVFRSAIDSSYLQMLQDWLICTLPTFLAQPEQQGVWGLSVIFLSASINLHLIKLFPLVLGIGAANTATTGTAAASATARKLGQHEIALFVTAAQDFHAKLSGEQRERFREAFSSFERSQVYGRMLQRL
ncbi:huntingtin isoform X3 [Drosophila kikkawai]|uniref:Huntingtin isoform X3 n=1 Tax=Drosophila kikkawai TaxID=30033 RepID=A0ABM4GLQ7_DROKI